MKILSAHQKSHGGPLPRCLYSTAPVYLFRWIESTSGLNIPDDAFQFFRAEGCNAREERRLFAGGSEKKAFVPVADNCFGDQQESMARSLYIGTMDLISIMISTADV